MGSPVLTISLVPSNLRQEEAYVQILDSLQQLDRVSRDVFDRIDAKSREQQTRLKAVTSRISVAEAKVEFLRGSKKAIRVFAASTFPASDKADEYQAIFADHSVSPQPMNVVRSDVKIRSRFPREVKPPQKLEVLPLVTVGDPGLHCNEMIHEGLGDIPAGVKSVSSLLLFNTAQNPYSKFVSSDPLGAPSKTRKLAEAAGQTSSLDAAPASVAGGDELGRKQDDLSYIPGFGEVPEFDLPNMLPDLPGVFEDLSFGDLESDFDIAVPTMDSFTFDPPTLQKQPEVKLPVISAPLPPTPNLPVISLLGPAAPPAPPAPPPPPPSTFSPPPPPAPPAPPAPPLGRIGSPPPPPPPPTSGLQVSPPAAPTTEAKAPSVKQASSSPDARSSLLESIRAAGGAGRAGLKNVKEKKLEQKKKKQEEKTKAVSGGGDLMGDLRSRLGNLRKGISKGARAGDDTSDSAPRRPDGAASFGGVMDRVSNMIPHSPTVGGPSRPVQEDEDDWN